MFSSGLAFTRTAGAAGFALAEQIASALGNAYAGVAAIAEDCEYGFFQSGRHGALALGVGSGVFNRTQGYAHLFANDATLNQNAGSIGAYGLLNGERESDINLLGVQLSVNF